MIINPRSNTDYFCDLEPLSLSWTIRSLMGLSLNLNTCLLSNVKKWFVVAGDPGLHHKWQGTILLIPEGLYICMSQGLRHPPLAPHHDIMVSACHDVLVCWLCWMLQFVLARGRSTLGHHHAAVEGTGRPHRGKTSWMERCLERFGKLQTSKQQLQNQISYWRALSFYFRSFVPLASRGQRIFVDSTLLGNDFQCWRTYWHGWALLFVFQNFPSCRKSYEMKAALFSSFISQWTSIIQLFLMPSGVII